MPNLALDTGKLGLAAVRQNHALLHEVPDRVGTQLPPAGASPAGDLQRRLSDATLRNFYAAPRSGWQSWRKPAAVVGLSVFCWALVFGAGALFAGL